MPALAVTLRAEADMTRSRALRVSALSLVALMLAGTEVEASPTVIPIAGCNSQLFADGFEEIFWTSSFATDAYAFHEDGSRSGEIVHGTGETLEVTVQWSTSDDQAGRAISIGPRGAGFSPGGVGGEVGEVDFNVNPDAEHPDLCEDVDPSAASYGNMTFTLTFTSLHKPARRGGGVAKGNAQFEIDVDVGDEVVSLGTNVHVATGTDPDE